MDNRDVVFLVVIVFVWLTGLIVLLFGGSEPMKAVDRVELLKRVVVDKNSCIIEIYGGIE